MLISELTDIVEKAIKIPRGIKAVLTLGKNSVVHIVPVENNGRIEVILTTIPPDRWKFVTKIKMHLSGEPGSMSKAAKVLVSVGINILISQAIAIDEYCTGHWTIFADLGAKKPHLEEGFNLETRCEEIRQIILEENEKEGFLKEKNDLQSVHLEPLRVLTDMYSKTHPSCVSNYKDGNILIPKEFENFWQETVHRRIPHKVVLTADSEECFCRLILPREWKIAFKGKIEVESSGSHGIGIYEKIIEFLSKYLNLWWCYNYISEKREKLEKATIHFVGEQLTSFDKTLKADEIREQINKIYLGKSRKIKAEKIELIDYVRPWCFLAYSDTRDPEEKINRIKNIIEKAGFNIKTGKTILGKPIPREVLQKIDESECLVSCFLSSYESEGTPSLWVIYEETLALSQDKPLLRIRDENVIPNPPPYQKNLYECLFGNDKEFEKALKDLERHLDALLEGFS